jgi:integrase
VFSLGKPKPGTSKEQRRYVVRWRVDGRDFKRRRKVKAEAERYRAQLLAAIVEGTAFDRGTGEPVSWRRSDLTWWQWSREWLTLKWPGWAATSRKSGVEALIAFTPHLVRERAPDPPAELRRWLWEVGYNPSEPATGPMADWLDRWSAPLDEIGPAVLERALVAGTTKANGEATAPTVAKRRRDLLNAALKSAVRRDLLATNPMDRVEWSVERSAVAVDITTLPSMADVDDLVDAVTALRTEGARYGAFFACIAYAGMRPSEIAALEVSDLELPKGGWGRATLRESEPSPGRRYTGTDSTRQRKALKHRPIGSVRPVPLPPPLVAYLRNHLDRWPSNDAVFINGGGRTVTAENYGKVWNRIKPVVWGSNHPAAGAVPYDLRHTAATVMIRAGVPLAEVARRLGHSVDVLLRVYAGLFADDEERSNYAIDNELRRQQQRS